MVCDRAQLKGNAKRIIGQGKMKVLWKVTLYLILTAIITQLVYTLSGYNEYMDRVVDAQTQYLEYVENVGEDDDLDTINDFYDDYIDTLASYPRVSSGAIIITFLLIIMASFLEAGFCWWCLMNTRNMPNDFRNIFDGFSFPLKLLGLVCLKELLIVIGYLLLIVPGVILTFSYSQSTYLLFENPERGVIECLRTSRRLMMGKKSNYFVLCLSFIGWILLNVLVSNVIASLFSSLGLGVLSTFSGIFFGTWYYAYEGFTMAGYYNWLTGYIPQEETSNDNSI